MDTTALRAAYDAFLSTAGSGDFGQPPAGEWSAEQVIAHVIAVDSSIATSALATISGQRLTFDNRFSLNEWNLARIIGQHADRVALIQKSRACGEIPCSIAEQLSDEEAEIQIRRLIITGTHLIADDSILLGTLIEGVGRIHLPMHARQLDALRAS